MDEQLEFAMQIAGRLASAGIHYMLTGSMAMAVYATPRMTRDIDMVVDIDRGYLDTLVRLFERDCYIDRSAVAEAIESKEFERRREINVRGSTLLVVAPEDLIVSKLEWARETGSELQRRDVRDMIASVPVLDWDYLEQWSDRPGLVSILREVRG